MEKFFSSANVIQTDVISRIQKLENNIPSNELYIAFEKDFLEYVYNFEKSNDNLNLSFIYPEKYISQTIYLQYNEVDEKLIETLSEDYFNFSELEGHYGIKSYFYQNMYYREFETNVIIDSERFLIKITTNNGVDTIKGSGVYPDNYNTFKELVGKIYE